MLERAAGKRTCTTELHMTAPAIQHHLYRIIPEPQQCRGAFKFRLNQVESLNGRS